jgi:ribonuclease-3
MNQIEMKTIDLEHEIKLLRDDFTLREKSPKLKIKTRLKFDGWIRQLNIILDQITKINETVLPIIKDDLGYSFFNNNLVLIAMCQSSIKNTFTEIKIHFPKGEGFVIPRENLDFLENCPEKANTLAWMGDTTIKYAVLLDIWKPGISTEQLHNKRKMYEENENLAKLCDKWKLFDYRIYLDPTVAKSVQLNKIKGTLVEALYGVIFLEKEIDGVRDAISLIKNS